MSESAVLATREIQMCLKTQDKGLPARKLETDCSHFELRLRDIRLTFDCTDNKQVITQLFISYLHE